MLRQWEEDFWIGPDVEKVDVSFLNLNREYGLWSKISLHFMFFRGGLIEKDITVEGVWLFTTWMDSGYLAIFCDIVFAILNVWIVLAEILRIRAAKKYYGGWAEWRQSPWESWNVVEWTTIGAAVALCVGVFFLFLSVQELTDAVKAGDNADSLYTKTEVRDHFGF